eukprot:1162132-Pelagomonas_calceolata.AAC.12
MQRDKLPTIIGTDHSRDPLSPTIRGTSYDPPTPSKHKYISYQATSNRTQEKSNVTDEGASLHPHVGFSQFATANTQKQVLKPPRCCSHCCQSTNN